MEIKNIKPGQDFEVVRTDGEREISRPIMVEKQGPAGVLNRFLDKLPTNKRFYSFQPWGFDEMPYVTALGSPEEIGNKFFPWPDESEN